MLRGNALAKVDEKGRIKIPSAFRSTLESQYGREYFVTSFRGVSALVYPLEVYTEFEQRLLGSSRLQPVVNRLRNAVNYFGQSTSMDGQGRILVHSLLRDRAAIDGEVAVLGQQNHLEIWNRAAFEERLGAEPLTDDDLKELASLGF